VWQLQQEAAEAVILRDAIISIQVKVKFEDKKKWLAGVAASHFQTAARVKPAQATARAA